MHIRNSKRHKTQPMPSMASAVKDRANGFSMQQWAARFRGAIK